MKLNNRDIIEIIGIISVVASLIFVGLQMRLEQRIAIADAYTYGIESRKSDLRSRLESDTYMRTQDDLWEDGYRPVWWSDKLTYNGNLIQPGAGVEAIRISVTLGILEVDNTYFRYQQGLVPDGYWTGARASLTRTLQDPFRRAVAQTVRSGISPIISELIEEIDSGTDT